MVKGQGHGRMLEREECYALRLLDWRYLKKNKDNLKRSFPAHPTFAHDLDFWP